MKPPEVNVYTKLIVVHIPATYLMLWKDENGGRGILVAFAVLLLIPLILI